MEKPDIQNEIKELIAGIIGSNPADLMPETDFWKDLGVDSIKAIEITVAIEKRYKISIRDEQIPKISNVGQAIAVVQEALEKKK